MKRWSCLILAVLMLLCACNPAAGTDRESESFLQSEKQTAAVSPDTVAVSEMSDTDVSTADAASAADDDDTPLTAVRYEKKYEIKRVTDGIVANYADRMYEYNGFLYHITADYQMKEDILYAVIHMYDAEGQLAATERLALPDSMDGTLPLRIFKLSDGRYLLFHIANIHIGQQDGLFQLIAADGTVQYQHEVKELRGLSSARIRVYEEDNGSFSIWYAAEQQFFMLDETLTQQMRIPVDSPVNDFIRMDDTYFLLMFGSSNICRANTKLGYASIYGLHLPKSYANQDVFRGANEQLYLSVPNGVYRYDYDRQPEMILKWVDLNLSGLNLNDRAAYDLWIIDDSHLYILYRQQIDGRATDVLYSVTITDVPVSEERQVLVLECEALETLPWLETVVRSFNLTNPDYRVDLRYITGLRNNEERDAYLQERLLSSAPPDMWMSWSDGYQNKYYDKNAFIDLMPLLGDRVLNSVLDACTWNDALYALPIGMCVKTLVSVDAVCDSALTWEKLYEITDGLTDGECLITYPIAEELFSASIMDFVDFENNTSEFHSWEYQQTIEYLQTMDSYCEKNLVRVGNGDLTFNGIWGISQGNLIPYLRHGDIKLLDVYMKNIQAYAALRLVYGDTPFTICGYPSRHGEGNAGMYGFYATSVLQSTEHPDGCLAFMEALFSVEAQTHPKLTEDYIPVTRDSLMALIDSCRYQYYQNHLIESINEFQPGMLVLEWDGTSAEYLDDFGYTKDTSDGYTVMEFTQEDKDFLLSFFDGCSFGVEADPKVAEIVKEELSYYAGQARSLSETTKIIDSRVWIYLNE